MEAEFRDVASFVAVFELRMTVISFRSGDYTVRALEVTAILCQCPQLVP